MNNEFFTLETLAKFYTKAAQAGGIQYRGLRDWVDTTNCPNTENRESEYRPKPAPPIVRWAIQFDVGTTHSQVFDTERDANNFKESMGHAWYCTKVIKLIQEQS